MIANSNNQYNKKKDNRITQNLSGENSCFLFRFTNNRSFSSDCFSFHSKRITFLALYYSPQKAKHKRELLKEFLDIEEKLTTKENKSKTRFEAHCL